MQDDIFAVASERLVEARLELGTFTARTLLDTGATRTFIAPRLAEQLPKCRSTDPQEMVVRVADGNIRTQAYEQQHGEIEDLRMPEENSSERQQCEAHLTLLRHLPSTDAVPQYERDEHNNLRLQEHWRVALQGLQE